MNCSPPLPPPLRSLWLSYRDRRRLLSMKVSLSDWSSASNCRRRGWAEARREVGHNHRALILVIQIKYSATTVIPAATSPSSSFFLFHLRLDSTEDVAYASSSSFGRVLYASRYIQQPPWLLGRSLERERNPSFLLSSSMPFSRQWAPDAHTHTQL